MVTTVGCKAAVKCGDEAWWGVARPQRPCSRRGSARRLRQAPNACVQLVQNHPLGQRVKRFRGGAG
eukprot:7095309-Heterocapsa_arctica.AAC.1